jgi:nucleoside 2-deoxyribosyltransferase
VEDLPAESLADGLEAETTPTSLQLRLLELAYEAFHESLTWPPPLNLEARLDKEGGQGQEPVEIEQQVATMPPGLVEMPQLMSGYLQGGQFVVSLRGLRLVPAAEGDLRLFVETLRECAEVARNSEPPSLSTPDWRPQVTSDELAGRLASRGIDSDPQSLMRVYTLLMHTGAGFFSGSGSNQGASTWQASLDRHRLRAFLGIKSIDDYLAIRDREIAEREAALSAMAPSIVRTPRRWLPLSSHIGSSSSLQAEVEQPSDEAARDVAVDPRLVFVLMPFQEKAEWSDTVYQMIKEVCASLADSHPNLQCSRADDITELGAINRQIVDRITSARAIVADITDNNPNVMYEVGVADGLSKPVILMNQHPGSAPFDVAYLRQMPYAVDGLFKAAADLTSFLTTELAKG